MSKVTESESFAVSLRQIADAQYTRLQRFNGRLPADVQEVLRMAADHLQAETALGQAEAAVVGYIEHSTDKLSQMTMTVDGLSLGIGRHAVYANPQPAPQTEPAGDCGSLEFAREAVSYSHNFATAKPDIGATEKEHILGLCKVVERLTAALAATGKQSGGERERFEAWAKSEDMPIERSPISGGYLFDETYGAWFTWQAATASRETVVPAGWQVIPHTDP